MNLVLIETSGNQAFIFATNKLRENVGASELTAQTGTHFVLKAVHEAGGLTPVREDLRKAEAYPALSADNPVEIILAISGKALLLVKDAKLGRQIVRSVTSLALQEAPGLEVRGVVSRDFDDQQDCLHALIGEVHREYEKVRSRLPGPTARFQRLPIVAECATSGLPAASYEDSKRDPAARSGITLAKRKAAQDGLNRIKEVVLRHKKQYSLPYSTSEIEELGCDWLAIVHADGNGLGEVFLKFGEAAGTQNNRDYISKLRSLSLALDECTERAFCEALAILRPKPRTKTLPIIPLVLGGDDLTVVCDGRQALQFTKKFIDCFEKETKKHQDITSIQKLSGGVTCCAGVAIVKPHFPFHAGYQLAEELLKEAKKLGKRDPNAFVSAIDYHILYDSSGPDLERIRRELTVDQGGTLLVGRPYLSSSDGTTTNRCWQDLAKRIESVRASDDQDNRRRLPNSMLHELREALFLGRSAADARLKLVLDRYQKDGLKTLLGNQSEGGSLFWEDAGLSRTALLDAVDTAEFWEAST